MSDCEHNNFLGALEYDKEHFQDFVDDHNSASKLIGELEAEFACVLMGLAALPEEQADE